MSVVTPIVDAASSPRPALGPHGLAQRVPCRICKVATGEPCVDAATTRSDPHHSRWIRYQQSIRTQPFHAIVLRDVGDDVCAGDLVTCVSDPAHHRFTIVADTLGRLANEEPVATRDVEFRGFIGDLADRRILRPGAARRAHGRTA